MKYGIFYAYWESEWGGDYLKYVDKVAGLGFDVLEIGGQIADEYSKEQIKELSDRAKAAGIELTIGYGPSYANNIATADKEARKNALKWYTKLFEVMQQLDSHLVGGAIYSYWPIDYSKGVNKEEDWKNSVEGMRVLGELAQKYDVNIGLEVLNRFENHILNTAEEALSYVREVGLSNVKIMLDTFHMNIEEVSIRQAILTAGKHLGHFHTGECNRMVPGKGRMPWREIGEALRDINYQGTVVMEPFPVKGGAVGADIKLWRDIVANTPQKEAILDKDARDALIFQHYMFDKA
ncbi:sugar phosphate isomerase/epimerase [Lachnospiraceae bacterium ZAX-1]